MKTICLVLHRFREDRKEAITKNYINLAEQLSLFPNISVTTFTPNNFSTCFKVEQTILKRSNDYESLIAALINLYLLCRLVRTNHHKFDVLNFHIATPVEVLIIYALLPKKVIKDKTVLSVWQSYLNLSELIRHFSYFLKNFSPNLHHFVANSFIVAVIYHLLLDKFKNVIVHCKYQKELLGRGGVKNIEFIQNGVFKDHKISERRFDQSVKTLVYIGHTKNSKGVGTLLKIVSLIKKKCQIKLVLATSGFGEMKTVHKLITCLGIGDNVESKFGIIDVFSELVNSQLLIVPFRTCVGTSLCPNILVEAISVGTPIAVPYFPELTDLLDGGRNGIVISTSNISVSADSIVEILNNPLKLKQISDNQLKFFREHLEVSSFIDKYRIHLTEKALFHEDSKLYSSLL